MDNDTARLVLLFILAAADAACAFLAFVNWREIDCHLKWKRIDYHLGKSWLFSRTPGVYLTIVIILSFFISLVASQFA